ncbi:hypothetical protein HAX54_024088 [Datura stramonium]|uniref:Uncharacterized protein n=1 Tax=Datura stramonium TaxID=4076 RepID=A0ABS8UXG4_DATST|nr:hypothetical protein [Datura stramonium]
MGHYPMNHLLSLNAVVQLCCRSIIPKLISSHSKYGENEAQDQSSDLAVVARCDSLICYLLMCFPSTDTYDSSIPTEILPSSGISSLGLQMDICHIQAPGWQLGWTWAKKEIIWDAVGGQATEQGDCSRFKGHPSLLRKGPNHCRLVAGNSI